MKSRIESYSGEEQLVENIISDLPSLTDMVK
jgi:hypothetical protein